MAEGYCTSLEVLSGLLFTKFSDIYIKVMMVSVTGDQVVGSGGTAYWHHSRLFSVEMIFQLGYIYFSTRNLDEIQTLDWVDWEKLEKFIHRELEFQIDKGRSIWVREQSLSAGHSKVMHGQTNQCSLSFAQQAFWSQALDAQVPCTGLTWKPG